MDCGRLASCVATWTTSAGRTKLNSVCWLAGAANSGVANNRANTAGNERQIMRTKFSLTTSMGQ
ncbi:hypothetical protein D3C77_690910 [compost metagenome]